MSDDDGAKTYDPSLEQTLEVSLPESTEPTKHSSGRGERLPWPVRMLISLLRKIRETASHGKVTSRNANPAVDDE